LFWRIVATIVGGTFFFSAIDIFSDPRCRTVDLQGSRFLISYSCTNGASTTQGDSLATMLLLVAVVIWALVWIGPILRLREPPKSQDEVGDEIERAFLETYGDQAEEYLRKAAYVRCKHCNSVVSVTESYCAACNNWR